MNQHEMTPIAGDPIFCQGCVKNGEGVRRARVRRGPNELPRGQTVKSVVEGARFLARVNSWSRCVIRPGGACGRIGEDDWHMEF